MVYLDDILIYTYSPDIEDHWRAVRLVLDRLREHKLYAKPLKCTFTAKEVEFLGFIISTNSVKADPRRVQTIMDWPTPTTLKELQTFLGFANFYRRFGEGYARKVRLLTTLTRG